MIIGKADLEGRPTLLLGLSHENVARMLRGEPIYHKAHPAMDGTGLIIMVGKTEQAMEQMLRDAGSVSDMTNVLQDNSIR